MGVRGAAGVMVILGAVMVCPAAGQSLADVARQEVVRRQQIKAPGKVLTNADLPAAAEQPAPAGPTPEGEAKDQIAKAGEATDAAGADTASPAPAPSAPATPIAPAGQKDDEDGWRSRASTVNTALAAARGRVRQLKALSDMLALEMLATDPAAASRAAAERDDVKGRLARAQSEEDAAFAERRALEQEARQSGVPPAWIQ